MKKKLKHLSSPYFVFSLAVLVLNDFYLKDHYHNFITGKLSDFFGLFIFVVFWAVLFPAKKAHVFFLTAILFIYWKSPFAQSFIDLWSRYLFPIHRTVDFTDLFSLLVLPVAWWYLSSKPSVSFINPYIVSVFTLFSFCATSLPHYEQQFEQPQYVLFIAPSPPDTVTLNYEGLTISKLGQFEVVQVENIPIKSEPVKSDDFQKKLILKDLDERVLDAIGRPRLKPMGINSLVIPCKGFKDIASFKNSRLHGKFERINESGEILISGLYHNGLEDSVWTFRDSIGDAVIKKTFKNGERVKIDSLYKGKLISASTVSTRAEVVWSKYFQVALLLILAFGMVVLVVKSFKRGYSEAFQIPLIAKWALLFTLPIFSLVVKSCISAIIPDAYNVHFIDAFVIYAFIYVTTIILFAMVLFAIGIRRWIDLLWYILLFALVAAAIMETVQISRLAG